MTEKEPVIQFLAHAASKRRTVTYGELAQTFGGLPNAWGSTLTLITKILHQRGLPLLPILVVKADNRLPSAATKIYYRCGIQSVREIRAEQQRCFNFDWSGQAI